MLVRDLGAVRILPERLASRESRWTLVPGSAILADDLDDLRNKVYYSFFQNHLAELIVAIVRHFEIDERLFWDEVAAVARRDFPRTQRGRRPSASRPAATSWPSSVPAFSQGSGDDAAEG